MTRFPPEPNGYLHIGHAKSICLNFGIAEEFGGRCHLRFDDTNPTKEEQEYIDAIEARRALARLRLGQVSLLCLGLFRAALRLGRGTDPAPARPMWTTRPRTRCALTRGTLTEPGQEQPVPRPRGRRKSRPVPPHARRRVSERRARAARQDRHGVRQHQPARSGAVPHPACRASAHRRHMVDLSELRFAHGQSDAIEGITHSICTLEFEDHRPLYDWFLENLPVPSRPHQYEFARLNLTYTVLSKRVLTELVRGGHVDGWDDPRMPTLPGCAAAACRRPRSAISSSASASPRRTAWSTSAMLEFAIREELNRTAQRRMAVLRPLKVVIENYPEGAERGGRGGQPSRRSGGRHPPHSLRPRALHRARRFHGKSAEEILSAVAGRRGAAALRLFHHLPRGR